MTANLKTHCVGRYLIDVPADALAFPTTKLQGVTVEAQAMSQADYQKAMEAHAKELKATKSLFGYQFLYVDTEIEGIPTSRYFVSLIEPSTSPDSMRLIEAYKWDRGYQFKLRIEASDAKNSVYFKDDPSVRDDPIMTDVRANGQLVVSLLDRVRGRTDDQISTEPGVCFAGGFLPGAGDIRYREDAFVQFVLKDHSDVSFDLDTDTGIQEPNTLLERGGDIHAMLRQNDGHTIRKGVLDFYAMQAEEWVAEQKSLDGVLSTYATLEANSKAGSAKAPFVNLTMSTGEGNRVLQDKIDRASLTESEAVALWDAVSRSLRPRPNGF
jgi:Tle cognate immunity protein 4 C-terminal domain/Tle cognate immunity protein 4 N-terminal domain